MTKARDLGDFISDGTIAETVTADGLNLGDNEKIQLGASQDLQLYHDGLNSYVSESGTGDLILEGSTNVIIKSKDFSNNMFKGYHDGQAELYHNGTKKFETSSTGATVTGTIAVSGDFNATSGTFTVQSNGTDILNVTSTLMSPQTDGAISIGSASNAFNDLHLDGSATIAGITYPTSDGSSGQFLKTDGSGNLSFATVSTTVGINDLTDGYNVGDSVGLGTDALANDDGSTNYNTAVGQNALKTVSTGTSNTAIGAFAGNLATGDYNTFSGHASGYNTTGDENVAVGRIALQVNTSGNQNTAVGHEAINQLYTGSGSTGIGYRALYGSGQTSHSYNTAVGASAGLDITTGVENFFGGYLAAKSITSGTYNVAIGSQALYYPSTGNNNVAIGREALYGGSGGNPYNNVAIGESSGRNLTGTHNSNTIVGHQAGSTVESSSNTLIGAAAGGNIITGSNNVAIGYNSQASSSSISNEITLGSATHNRLRIPGITSGASDGDALVWNATYGTFETGAAGGGAYELLSTTTVSSSTYNVFMDWGSSYSGHFKLIIQNMTVNTTNGYFSLRFRTGSSSATSSYYSIGRSNYPTNTSSFSKSNDNLIQLTEVDTASESAGTLNGEIEIFAANVSNKNTFGQSRIVQMPGSPASYNYVAGSNAWFTRNNTTAITGLNLFHASAQITGGIFKLYRLS